MHDDYLWDRSGLADPDVAALERTLAPLRYEAEPLRLPPAQPRRHAVGPRWWTWALPIAAAAAAAAMVLVLRADAVPDAPSALAPTTVETLVTEAPVAEPAPAVLEAVDEVETPPAVAASTGGLGADEPGGDATRQKQGTKPRKKQRPSEAAPPTVDCILDPAACEPLPDRLSSSDIRKGIQPIKPSALACAKGRDVPPGTRMKVKMTIRGDSGRVSAVTALPPWSGTSVGECVAEAVAKARFPRFKKDQLGVMYPFTLSSSGESAKAEAGRKPVPASAVIREEMVTIRTKARACAVAHDAESGTPVELSLNISPQGAVKSVKVDAKPALPADAERCLIKAIGKIEFRRSDKGVRGRISIML